MKKQIKGYTVRELAHLFQTSWDKEKKNFKMSPRSLFNLLKLKKEIEQQGMNLEEAMVAILEQEGCERIEGTLKYNIPEDKKDLISNKFDDLVYQDIDIQYDPIKINDDDKISTEFFDALFEFIEM